MKISTPRVIRGFGYEPYVYDSDGQEKPLRAYNGNLILGVPDIPVSSNQFPEALTPDKTISITYNSTNGTIVVDDNQRLLVGNRLYNSSDYDITKRTFTLSPSTVYHLRFTTLGLPVNNFTPPHKGFYLVSLSDPNYNPNSLPLRAEEWNRPDDFIVADIITDANGTPTIYRRKLDRLEALRNALNKLKVIYKEVWVNPLDGDDRNDGSQEAPFKTLDKALLPEKSQLIQAWNLEEGFNPYIFLMVYLIAGQTYDLTKRIGINRMFVNIYGDATNPPKITNTAGGQLYVRWAGLYFESCQLDNSGGRFIQGWGGLSSRVSFDGCSISIGASDFINYGTYQHFHITLGGTDIVKTSTGLLVNCNGSTLDYFRGGGTITDSAGTALTDTDIIGGIIRDANGVPRNVQSNIVL